VARRTRLHLALQAEPAAAAAAAHVLAAAGRELFAALPGSPPQAAPAPYHTPPELQQVRAAQASLPPAADLSAGQADALPLPQAAPAAPRAPQAASAGERLIPAAELPAVMVAAPELNQTELPSDIAEFSQPAPVEQAPETSQPQPLEIPSSFSAAAPEPPLQQAAAAYSASRLADLWPALPDTWQEKPAQPARLSQDVRFRQRLDREQRGRAWNE